MPDFSFVLGNCNNIAVILGNTSKIFLVCFNPETCKPFNVTHSRCLLITLEPGAHVSHVLKQKNALNECNRQNHINFINVC